METKKWSSASRRIHIHMAIAALCTSGTIIGSVLWLFATAGSPMPQRVEIAQCRSIGPDRHPVGPASGAIGKRAGCGVRAPPEKS